MSMDAKSFGQDIKPRSMCVSEAIKLGEGLLDGFLSVV